MNKYTENIDKYVEIYNVLNAILWTEPLDEDEHYEEMYNKFMHDMKKIAPKHHHDAYEDIWSIIHYNGDSSKAMNRMLWYHWAGLKDSLGTEVFDEFTGRLFQINEEIEQVYEMWEDNRKEMVERLEEIIRKIEYEEQYKALSDDEQFMLQEVFEDLEHDEEEPFVHGYMYALAYARKPKGRYYED